VSRPALRPTQPPLLRVPGALSPGVKRDRGVTLITNPHLVPGQEWVSTAFPLHFVAWMAVVGQFTLHQRALYNTWPPECNSQPQTVRSSLKLTIGCGQLYQNYAMLQYKTA
jgi:hypothetical protein